VFESFRLDRLAGCSGVTDVSTGEPAGKVCLYDATVMLGDFRIEKLAAQRFEAFERALLVRSHQPRIPRHIGGQHRGEPPLDPCLRHRCAPVEGQQHTPSGAMRKPW
jgi:hypothetical protein